MITLVNLASRLVGFLRQIALVANVGPTAVGDIYLKANTVPNVMFEVAAGGALAGAIVPLLAGPVARRARVESSAIASALLTWALVILVPVAVLVALLADLIVPVLNVAPGEPSELAAYFLRVFALQIPLYGVGTVMSGVLQSHRRFFWPAAAPMLSSVVVIATYVVFGAVSGGSDAAVGQIPASALAWLAWGTTAGVVAMSLPLLVPAYRTGLRLRLTLRFPGGEGRRARALAIAGVGALLAQQVSVVAVMWSSGRFDDDGAYTVYFSTQTVYFLPYAILAVPLATSAFPRLAQRASAGDRAGFSHLLALTTRGLLTITAAGAAALVAASAAVESAFSSFSQGSVAGMTQGVVWMAPGLLGFALIFHLSRALYSLDHGRSAVLATSAGWLVAAACAVVLPALVVPDAAPAAARTAAEAEAVRDGILAALGAASSIGMTVAGVLLLLAVRRHGGPRTVEGLGRTLPVALGGAVAGGVLGYVLTVNVLPAQASLAAAIAVGLGGALVAVAVLLAASLVLDRSALVSVLRPSAVADD